MSILDKGDALFVISQKCGECKNNVGHHWSSVYVEVVENISLGVVHKWRHGLR